jgi:hypothetical protein
MADAFRGVGAKAAIFTAALVLPFGILILAAWGLKHFAARKPSPRPDEYDLWLELRETRQRRAQGSDGSHSPLSR